MPQTLPSGSTRFDGDTGRTRLIPLKETLQTVFSLIQINYDTRCGDHADSSRERDEEHFLRQYSNGFWTQIAKLVTSPLHLRCINQAQNVYKYTIDQNARVLWFHRKVPLNVGVTLTLTALSEISLFELLHTDPSDRHVQDLTRIASNLSRGNVFCAEVPKDRIEFGALLAQLGPEQENVVILCDWKLAGAELREARILAKERGAIIEDSRGRVI